MTERSTRPIQVVILGDWLAFPHGMAASVRARLVARALSQAGMGVRVLTLQPVDRPPHVENKCVRGEYMGIPFEYACGTTVRHKSFVMRRIIEAWGWVNGSLRIVQLRRQGVLDLVLLWFWTPRPAFRLLWFTALLHLLRVPIVREVDEATWAHKMDRSILERLWSPLCGMKGALTISRELHEWVVTESAGRLTSHIVDVPILVDVQEQEPTAYPTDKPLVVFAGSPEYRKTIRFILTAMLDVWREHPSCRIAITGAGLEDPRADWLRAEVTRVELGNRVDLVGYLSRPGLLDLYARAHVLLIPLFDDQQSRTRFPTKIGEYLAAARPIVTNSVGDIPLYLRDGVDAILCPPDDAVAFGRAIGNLLLDPARAALIGRRGRHLAETVFDYALHGENMARAFRTIAAAEN